MVTKGLYQLTIGLKYVFNCLTTGNSGAQNERDSSHTMRAVHLPWNGWTGGDLLSIRTLARQN